MTNGDLDIVDSGASLERNDRVKPFLSRQLLLETSGIKTDFGKSLVRLPKCSRVLEFSMGLVSVW